VAAPPSRQVSVTQARYAKDKLDDLVID